MLVANSVDKLFEPSTEKVRRGPICQVALGLGNAKETKAGLAFVDVEDTTVTGHRDPFRLPIEAGSKTMAWKHVLFCGFVSFALCCLFFLEGGRRGIKPI